MQQQYAHVSGAEVIGPHRLRLTFEDGLVGEVQFDREDWTGVLSPLRDPATFSLVSVDRQLGTLVWPGGLDLAPEPLYEAARRHRAARPAA